MRGKYSQKLLKYTKQSATDALKTFSKRAKVSAEINDDACKTYNINSQTKFKSAMIKVIYIY